RRRPRASPSSASQLAMGLEDASVHDDEEPRIAGAERGGLVHDPFLEPDRLRADPDRLVDDAARELAAPEDVDDLDGRGDGGEVGPGGQAAPVREVRIHGEDRVALRLHVDRDAVRRARRPVGEPDDGEPAPLTEDAFFDRIHRRGTSIPDDILAAMAGATPAHAGSEESLVVPSESSGLRIDRFLALRYP